MPFPYCYLFDSKYAAIQQLTDFQFIQTDSAQLAYSIEKTTAISLPQSPFGGIFTTNEDQQELFQFLDQAKQELTGKVRQLLIKQPIHVYPSVATNHLIDYGFQKKLSEISHFVDLINFEPDQLHLMQKRKLDSSSFDLQLLPVKQLPSVHEFIENARAEQGIHINTSLDTLSKQFEAFPDRFLIYGAYHLEELAATCIVSLPTDDIAYYFLPASSATYRSKSPMVALMVYLYDDLRKRGFTYLDLGVSSINGVPQHSLINFKERMGGIYAERSNLVLNIE
ncbi:hypothetical protein [Marinoscillum sp.]|uniref:hypothetical protein n=1 Tax=Marinoscillum sp. TaxID=2024838 RepID=UPI003BAC25B6